jgi:hypothetical protein
MTNTTDYEISPNEVGNWMALCALAEWSNYDDNGTFEVNTIKFGDDNKYFVSDPDEDASVTFTGREFFEAHKRLIWNAEIDNYRHDWIEFAFKSKGAEPDEYDALTCEAVLQNLLYGEIVYG